MASKNDRLEVRFDPDEWAIWPASVTRKTKTNRMAATILHYVDNPANRTPTGGRFRSQRMTIRTPDGRKWVGQMKKDTDIVRLRPADD